MLKNKSFDFYLSLVGLAIWIIYSWSTGPTRSTIEAKFKAIPIEKTHYVIKYNSHGTLLSGKVNDVEYENEKLESVLFSLNGQRNQVIIDAINSSQRLLFTSTIDTVEAFNTDMLASRINEIKLKTQFDTIIEGNPLKTVFDIAPFKRIIISQNSGDYLELSLMAFEDINRKYEGAAPQDIDKFIDIIERLDSLFQGKLVAKILTEDTIKTIPLIYEITDMENNLILRDEYAFDLLKTEIDSQSGTREDTEFVVWYKRFQFWTVTFFILLYLFFAYLKMRKYQKSSKS